MKKLEDEKKVEPLDLHLEGQLGQENLALVIAKVNEIIEKL